MSDMWLIGIDAVDGRRLAIGHSLICAVSAKENVLVLRDNECADISFVPSSVRCVNASEMLRFMQKEIEKS